MVVNPVEWSGVEWSGVEWSGVEWSGVEWSGVEWSGVEWSGSMIWPMVWLGYEFPEVSSLLVMILAKSRWTERLSATFLLVSQSYIMFLLQTVCSYDIQLV
eukprot:scaffold8419_cov62-Attheya_sp.AAC.7